MARIRTIKPNFWDKDECANVSMPALLLYIGMKNFADDHGVIPGSPKLIKSKVFPQRDDVRIDQVNKWITELLENSFLVQLTYEDKLYYVLDFSDEKIDKPQPSILPDEAFENIREYSRIVETDREDSKSIETIRLGEERKGEERKGKEEVFFPWDSKNFIDMWEAWKKYKKEQFKFSYKSAVTEQAALKELNDLSKGLEDVAIKIIEKSISSGWKGFFELKENGKQSNNQAGGQGSIFGPQRAASVYDKYRQELNKQ